MRQYQIENVECGLPPYACRCTYAEVCLRDLNDGSLTFQTLVADEEGHLDFFLSEESLMDEDEVNYEDEDYDADFDDVKFEQSMELMDRSNIGYYFDYEQFYEALTQHKVAPEELALIWKYLVCVIRLEWDESNRFQKQSIGKIFGEFKIPVCDVEQNYMDGCKEG